MTAVKTTGSINEALAALQGNLPRIGVERQATVRSDKGNYSYRYAGLNDVNEALLPALAAVGLAFTARPTIDGDRFVLAYALHHKSGEELHGNYPLPDPSRATPQQIGSAITYARRYCILAVTGLAPDPDDDGQAANHAPAGERMERKAERGVAPEDPWANVEVAKPPIVTDARWWQGWNGRVAECDNLAELKGLHGELVSEHQAGHVEDKHRTDGELLVKECAVEIKANTAVPA